MEIKEKNILNDLEYLRQISKPIDLSNDNYLKIIKVLKEYCYLKKENILAIASVQLGIPYRLVYVKNIYTEDNFDPEHDEGMVLINPRIVRKEGLTRFYECCASCLDYMGLVERPYKIEVEYIDEKKESKSIIAEGMLATILSHEIDHLNGILHIDKSIELYYMKLEERKEFRKKHKYEVIRKTGEFIQTNTDFKSIDDIKLIKKFK